METLTEDISQSAQMKCICPKHGDVGNYVYRVHMPEFGQEHMHYCLVCAVEYLSMIAQEVKLEPSKYQEGDAE